MALPSITRGELTPKAREGNKLFCFVMRGPTSNYYWYTNQKQAHASEYDKIIHAQLHELEDVTEYYIC